MNPMQEKFEVREPYASTDDARGGWVSDKSARVKKGTPGREGRTGGDWGSKTTNNGVFYGSLPPGTDISDEEVADIRKQYLSAGGLGSGDQATVDVTVESLAVGFSRKKMRPTDDLYTNEHQDMFYADITVDGVTGFVERGNTLDRG
jgi:hypothetical protein